MNNYKHHISQNIFQIVYFYNLKIYFFHLFLSFIHSTVITFFLLYFVKRNRIFQFSIFQSVNLRWYHTISETHSPIFVGIPFFIKTKSCTYPSYFLTLNQKSSLFVHITLASIWNSFCVLCTRNLRMALC